MKIRKRFSRVAVVLGACWFPLAQVDAGSAAITMPMVPVGNTGNAADPSTGLGSVAYSYNMGEYDVTATQYTAFLNAVAKADPYGLYNPDMAGGFAATGILQAGRSGSYTYTTIRNGNFPVNYVTWGDAARFANWLTNGQPTGAEGNGTTETGSYTLNGATTDAALNSVTRNSNADYVIPTENEWYKTAYYNPSTSSYYLYPTSSNTQPINVLSATSTDSANYYDATLYTKSYTDPADYLTAVGAFAGSVGPYGTYDQGGDVFQWNEAVYPAYSGSYRGLRGGSFDASVGYLEPYYNNNEFPSLAAYDTGFRLAQVPEPASTGFLCLAASAILSRRRVVGK